MDIREQHVVPRVNILEGQDRILIEAELPGVARDGVSLEVKNRELVLTGRRQAAEPAARPAVMERPRHDYQRSFLLGETINVDAIEGVLRDGVLTVTLPKKPVAQARKITVN